MFQCHNGFVTDNGSGSVADTVTYALTLEIWGCLPGYSARVPGRKGQYVDKDANTRKRQARLDQYYIILNHMVGYFQTLCYVGLIHII